MELVKLFSARLFSLDNWPLLASAMERSTDIGESTSVTDMGVVSRSKPCCMAYSLWIESLVKYQVKRVQCGVKVDKEMVATLREYLQLASVIVYIFLLGDIGSGLFNVRLQLQLHLCINVVLVNRECLELLHRHYIRFFGVAIARIFIYPKISNFTKSLDSENKCTHKTNS